MKVYIAAPYEEKRQAALCASLLSETFEIVSTWHDTPDGDYDNTLLNSYAHLWRLELESSDLVICMNHLVSKGGGMHFEAGYATALNIPVLYTEEPKHIFRFLHQLGAEYDVIRELIRIVME